MEPFWGYLTEKSKVRNKNHSSSEIVDRENRGSEQNFQLNQRRIHWEGNGSNCFSQGENLKLKMFQAYQGNNTELLQDLK